MVRRVRLLRGLAVGWAALVTSCAKSPEAKAKEASAQLASWQATLRLLEEQRARGAVPERYARQVARAVEQGRAQALGRLRAASTP